MYGWKIGCIHEWMVNGSMAGWMVLWTDETLLNGWMDECIDRWLNGWMNSRDKYLSSPGCSLQAGRNPMKTRRTAGMAENREESRNGQMRG